MNQTFLVADKGSSYSLHKMENLEEKKEKEFIQTPDSSYKIKETENT